MKKRRFKKQENNDNIYNDKEPKNKKFRFKYY